MNKIMKGALAVVGGLVIVAAIGATLNMAIASEKVVVDKSGNTVKLTDVVAEATTTGLVTSVNGSAFSKAVIFQMKDLPKGTESLITQAGATTMDLTQVEGTFCFVSFVTYMDTRVGKVDVPMGAECKAFPAGTVLGAVVSFAEDYTKEITSTYKTKFNVLK